MLKDFINGKTKIRANGNRALLASAMILVMTFAIIANVSSAQIATVNAQPTFGNPSSYGDLSQYTWPSPRGNPANTGFSPGPAPNAPDIAWSKAISGISGMTAVFNGLVFAESSNTLYAINAQTGAQVWQATINTTQGVARIGPTQIDSNYLIVYDGHQIDCFNIATGAFVWQTPNLYTGPNSTVNPGGSNGGLLPGGPDYMAGIYAPDTKMDYMIGYNGMTSVIYAFDLSNPSQAPPVAWTYVTTDGGNELLCYGNGALFVGGDAYRVYALNGTTGALLWSSPKNGYGGQMGVYQATSSTNGIVYAAADSTVLTAYDALNGSELWSYNAGGRAFFSYGGTSAYGRYYQHNDQNIPGSFFACWSQQTGEMLWQQPATYQIGYLAPVSADGKIFVSTSDGAGTTNQSAVPATFTCFDAFTGQNLWSLPLNMPFPAVAYGNVYGIAGGSIYCISTPNDWSMWHGNINNPGMGQSATTNISFPLWTYKTNGAITSSPTVYAGKVYIGSQDHNIYCLNAYDGSKIWNYTIGKIVLSSQAEYNGKVYTGAGPPVKCRRC